MDRQILVKNILVYRSFISFDLSIHGFSLLLMSQILLHLLSTQLFCIFEMLMYFIFDYAYMLCYVW